MAFEIPLYRFRKGVSYEAAREAARRLDQFLATAPGFVARRTIHDRAQDVWIDLVEWESMELALQAGEEFMASPFAAEFAALAEPGSVLMHHGEIVDEFRRPA